MTTGTAIPYFLYSFGIVFREGLEAFLVVLALAAGARRSGNKSQVRDIYVGAGAALIVSLFIAWAVQHLLSDDAGDTMEGIFQLFAAATLFYVSSWMTSKSQAQRWTTFIASKVDAARGSECTTIALAAAAFLAVLREGAETIIFFQALAAGATETVERHAVLFRHFDCALCTRGNFHRAGNCQPAGVRDGGSNFGFLRSDDSVAGTISNRPDHRGPGAPDCDRLCLLRAPANPALQARCCLPAVA